MNDMKFMEALERETYVSYTEQGMRGYKTTGSALVDLNFAVSSLRSATAETAVKMFKAAYSEDRVAAILWLFYAADIREGLGERDLFINCFRWLALNHQAEAEALLKLIPEYTRWDYLWRATQGTPLYVHAMEIVKNQFRKDQIDMKYSRPISLLAKWLPSINASNINTINLGKYFATYLYNDQKNKYRLYRKQLSAFRKYLNVTETYTCSRNWGGIEYSIVPSKANIKYHNAFDRHDSIRYSQYNKDVAEGKERVIASVTYPHEIVHEYHKNTYESFHYIGKISVDPAIENLWKALPREIKLSDTICVIDGSGSMYANTLGHTKMRCAELANAMGIYLSEISTGQFKNKFITFSREPKLISINESATLLDKLEYLEKFNVPANTDIEAVFKLILNTATYNNMKQEDIPKNILIISDMEFDSCTENASLSVFDHMKDVYKEHGYELPRLIFWNAASRTNTIPMVKNDNGLVLMSGFSINTLKLLFSGETDPGKVIYDILQSKRYIPVALAISFGLNTSF